MYTWNPLNLITKTSFPKQTWSFKDSRYFVVHELWGFFVKGAFCRNTANYDSGHHHTVCVWLLQAPTRFSGHLLLPFWFYFAFKGPGTSGSKTGIRVPCLKFRKFMNSDFLMAFLVENHDGSCKFDRSELHFNGVSCPPELLMHLGWYSLSIVVANHPEEL